MEIQKILVEGESLAVYLKTIMAQYSDSLMTLSEKIVNAGSASELNKKLEKLISHGAGDGTYIIYDRDIMSGEFINDLHTAINHPYQYGIPKDFEDCFPSWILAEALQEYRATIKKDIHCFSEVEIERLRNVKDSRKSIFEKISSIEPAIYSKVLLANCLAAISTKKWYRPKKIRNMLNEIIANDTSSSTEEVLITNRVESNGFIFNLAAIREFGLSGQLSLTVSHGQENLGDLWVFDINECAPKMLIKDIAEGPPCWSYDGTKIVFHSKTPRKIPNAECIRTYDYLSAHLGDEVLSIGGGGSLCWDGKGLIYGNSLQSHYQVHSIDRDGKRRVLSDLPKGAILSCIDRKGSKVLIGDQSVGGGCRIVGIYRINDMERLWSNEKMNIKISEYDAGSFSSDGKRIAVPIIESNGSAQQTSLWTIEPAGHDQGNSVRLTTPDGELRTSCWSPDDKFIAFMWKRWENDLIRLWIVELATGRLEPLIQGSFEQSIRALGCHSWISHADESRSDQI